MSEQIANATTAGPRRPSIVGARAVAVAMIGLAVAAPAFAQQAPKAKTAGSKSTVLASTAKAAGAALIAAPAAMETWHCELGNSFRLGGDLARDMLLTVNWQGRNYSLPRVETTTGAERYFDAASGIDLVIIPSKAMLFNSRRGQRLADECTTAGMRAGEPAPTRAEALRAPVVDPLTPQEQADPPGLYPERRQ